MYLLYVPLPGSVSAVGVSVAVSASVMSIDVSASVMSMSMTKGQFSSVLEVYYHAAHQYRIDTSICNVLSTRNVGANLILRT